jgi:hypothetical protein
METSRIEVAQAAGSEHCILEEDGARVADAVAAVVITGTVAELSFAGVEMLTTPFIRSLFGPLLEQFSSEQLNTQLQMTGMAAGDRARVKFVIDDLKLRLRDPQAYDRARQHALELA